MPRGTQQKWTPELSQRVGRLLDEGWSHSAVALRMALTKSQVTGFAQRRKVQPPALVCVEADPPGLGQCDCGSWVCRTLHERGPFRCSMCRGARMLQIVADRRRIAA